MKNKLVKFKKELKRRAAFSLIELLIAVVVLGILSGMLIAAGTASQNKARISVAVNDIDSFKNAVYQALITHPEVMKYTDKSDTQTSDLIAKAVELINEELDESFKLTYLDVAGKSGAAAYTSMQRDPWSNPYGLYIYTDTNTTTYNSAKDESGNTSPLSANDSCMYIVLVSSGPNGSGSAAGVDGNNIAADTGAVNSSAAMVNNSDGIDDIGVIIRIKNGSTYYATFGSDSATLGKLKGVQWIYGCPNSEASGILYDFSSSAKKNAVRKTAPEQTTYTMGGSVDEYPDKSFIPAGSQLVGAWGT